MRSGGSIRPRLHCQKAPSAKRCIKTSCSRRPPCSRRTVRKHRAPKGALRPWVRTPLRSYRFLVRKHRAPKGALRPSTIAGYCVHDFPVRKHRAPKGALRPKLLDLGIIDAREQKAPSAKRCIKTVLLLLIVGTCFRIVRKHQAPRGALRP